MIGVIHSVLASPPILARTRGGRTFQVQAQRTGGDGTKHQARGGCHVLCKRVWGSCWAAVLYSLDAVVSAGSLAWTLQGAVARFIFILFVVIPFLACAFVGLGALFHVPRMAAAFACKYAIRYCWWHARTRRRRGVHGAETCSSPCSGCCYTCRLASFLDSRTVLQEASMQWPHSCCSCGRSLH